MKPLEKHCWGCLEVYYGPTVRSLFCSQGCADIVIGQLERLGEVNREQCKKHDAEIRRRELATTKDEYTGGSAHQALERAEMTSEEPTGQPTMMGRR